MQVAYNLCSRVCVNHRNLEDGRQLLFVEQTRGQRQTGRNDLPGKGERVAEWMVIVESKKC